MNREPYLVSVLYWPSIEIIRKFAVLAGNGVTLCLVSNGCGDACRQALKSLGTKIIWIDNAKNVGLASAINQGLQFFIDTTAAKNVIYIDQDSTPTAQLLRELIICFENARHETIAAVAPQLKDAKSRHVARPGKRAPTLKQVLSVPSSGTCFSREALLDVGLMDEQLFIDGIDHEWCARAKSCGYRVLQASHLEMPHDMGEAGLTIMGTYKPLYTNPLRHYYITRNTLLLCQRRYMPIKWRIAELAKTLYRVPAYLLISADRMRSLQFIVVAVLDSLRLRTGPHSFSMH